MTINKKSIDTLLVMLCMLAPITPVFYAKKLVIIFFSFLVFRILVGKDLFYLLNIKILIFVLFLPSMMMSIFYPGEDFYRFWPVLLIVFAFPFSDFKINYSKPLFLIICIFYFLIITQFFLAYGDDFFLNFRDKWYPHVAPHKFDGGFTDSLIESIFSGNRTKRFGGLYHNPNDLAGMIMIYFLIFDCLSKNQLTIYEGKKKIFFKIIYVVTLVLIISSLFLTSSRAVLVPFIVYLFFKNLDFKAIKEFKIKKAAVPFLLISIVIFFLIIESVFDGIFAERSSFLYKFNYFFKYIEETNFYNLMIGGNFGLFFDQEYGYWLASSGLIGYLAFIIFFRMMIKIVPTTKLLILVFLLIGLGATVFYNFMLISIVTSLLIINSSLYFNNIKLNKK
ncbi:hypothetical protein N8950_00335 [Candidatus Pelagibacter sp.]|nr:hypothetical protein [Candidatus Pelagibacter sp.]